MMPIPTLTDKAKARFLSKVSIVPTADGCMEWMAGRNKAGYGTVSLGNKTFVATRIMYALHYGIDPSELNVCHTCDNPPCINPEHLFLGTKADNMQDMLSKGRANKACGERHRSRTSPETLSRGDTHNSSKLTAADIPLIRADTRMHCVIADEYGVVRSVISNIKRRHTWKHIA